MSTYFPGGQNTRHCVYERTLHTRYRSLYRSRLGLIDPLCPRGVTRRGYPAGVINLAPNVRIMKQRMQVMNALIELSTSCPPGVRLPVHPLSNHTPIAQKSTRNIVPSVRQGRILHASRRVLYHPTIPSDVPGTVRVSQTKSTIIRASKHTRSTGKIVPQTREGVRSTTQPKASGSHLGESPAASAICSLFQSLESPMFVSISPWFYSSRLGRRSGTCGHAGRPQSRLLN
ncbi:hypothetical protein RRG08_014305 [Elysia crispata]|uniref:Uncharacterized protein n=1 Tax=Elysia crispata TaxID=231223 RepID=A0AAE1D8E1_9GAST|nr:hypothetical protein RRG08_014305 [Elysia crispata]